MKHLKGFYLPILSCFLFLLSCKKEKLNPANQISENPTSVFKSSRPGYQFQTLDVPLSWGSGTSAFGNSNTGKIVGNYVTKNQEFHGFIFDNGQFTDVFLPEADKDNRGGLTDINDGSVSIGSFNYPKNIDHDQVIHSFQRSATGIFTILPDAIPRALLTEAMGINNPGTIVGFYYDENSSRHGFIFRTGIFITYDKPGAARTLLMGINDQGKIVGFYRDANGIGRGFALLDGITEEIIFPGATETRPHGINKTGQIVGEYIDNMGITHGFILKGGNYITFDFPGSYDTALLGINDNGVIVGTYDGFSHGMIATPN
jgi:uncharacterized membrane protein